MNQTRVPHVGDLVTALGQNGTFWVVVPSLNGLQTAILRLVNCEDFAMPVPWGVLSYVEEDFEGRSRYTERLLTRADAYQQQYVKERQAAATLKTAEFPISPQIQKDSIERHERRAAELSLLLDDLKTIIGARAK